MPPSAPPQQPAASSPTLPPRIIILSDDQWARAGLRAELRERGYDAIGATSIEGAARHVLPDPGRGPVRLVIADQDALSARAVETLARWRVALGAPIVLLAHATRGRPAAPWDAVLMRPLSVGDVERVVRTLVPLPPEAGPLDVR